jgi:preprotein translocase subunit YajC
MSTNAIIMMIVMLVSIWGAFFYFLQRAYKREQESKKSEKIKNDR